MIGEEIRRRREMLGLTGAELAAKAGMAASAVSQIETGKRTPSSTSVLKLAYALGVEVGELYPKKAQSPLPLEGRPRAVAPVEVSEAYFVEPEEGEEPDIVTLRLYVWRMLEKDDALLQKVAKFLQQRDKTEVETK